MPEDNTVLQKALVFFTENIKPNILEFGRSKEIIIWTIALVVGLCAAYAAIGFRIVIGWIQLPWLGTSSERVFEAASELPLVHYSRRTNLWRAACWPAAGVYLMPGKRAYGVADVIEAQALRNSKISLQAGLGNALLSVLSLGFGASAGREGPVVHLGATIASWLEDRFFSAPKCEANHSRLRCSGCRFRLF